MHYKIYKSPRLVKLIKLSRVTKIDQKPMQTDLQTHLKCVIVKVLPSIANVKPGKYLNVYTFNKI